MRRFKILTLSILSLVLLSTAAQAEPIRPPTLTGDIPAETTPSDPKYF